MIKFKGTLTGEAKKYFQRWITKNNSHFFLIGSVFFLAIMYAFLYDKVKSVDWLCISIAALSLSPAVRYVVPLTTRETEEMMPINLIVDDNKITATTKNNHWTIKIQDVKTVREFDDFYVLIFRKLPGMPYFICQKDLLIQGAEEEFRALFDGKIERISAYDKQMRDSNERVICVLLALVGIGALVCTFVF